MVCINQRTADRWSGQNTVAHSPALYRFDPRIPDASEAFEFQLNRNEDVTKVRWILDNKMIGESDQASYIWPLVKGKHILTARARYSDNRDWIETQPVKFTVK